MPAIYYFWTTWGQKQTHSAGDCLCLVYPLLSKLLSRFHSGFGYLQGLRFHNIPGRSVPVLDYLHCGKALFISL